MNLNRRWSGVRVLAAVLALVAAGCMMVGWGSRAGRPTASASPSPSSPGPADFLAGFSAAAQLRNAKHVAPAQAQALLAGLPLIFEPNQGQANLDPNDSRARFIARGSGYSLFLGAEGATLALQSRNSQPGKENSSRAQFLQMKLAGANPHAAIAAAEPLAGKSNYILGNDPAAWRHGIPQFARVRYENLYPGINLVFYGNQGRLEYDFQVAPGADPAQAELEFNGAQNLKVQDGALLIQLKGSEGNGGSLRFEAPRVYQKIDGREQAVAGGFVLRGAHRAGFAIGPYNRSRELVIDPQLTYTTYFGGAGNELSTSVAVLYPYIYISGSTNSTNLPVPDPATTYQAALNPAANATNVYIAVINPIAATAAQQVVYLTYLGGSGTDIPAGVAVDGGGNVYVAGTTSSTNFPVSTDAYQTSIYPGSTGTTHVFASELNNTLGTLGYSTYLSGNGTDAASGMTIDAGGHLFVTGTTTSNNASSTTVQFPASSLPYAQPFQYQAFSTKQFFVTEVNTATGVGTNSITYSTYFGGGSTFSGAPIVTGGQIAVDKNENIYFTGTTNFIYIGGQVNDFPILNAYQPCLDQPPATIIINPQTCTYSSSTGVDYALPDAFVAKLNPAAPAQLQFSTYLGGTQSDSGTGIALDTSGNVYVTGTTNSPDFVAPTSVVSFAPFQQCLNNEYTSTSGTITCSETVTSCTAGTPCGYDNDAFVAKLSAPASGSTTTNVQLTYFSFLGGAGDEQGNAITVDTGQGAVMTGWTQSPFIAATPPATGSASGSFPATGCLEIECNLAGFQDAYIARLNTETQDNQQNPAASWATYFGSGTLETGQTEALTEGTSITLDPSENYYIAGDTNSASNLPGGGGFQPNNAGGSDAFITELRPDSAVTISGLLFLGNNQTYVSAGNQATFVYTVTNTGPDIAPVLTITDVLNQTGVAIVPNSITATGGLCNTVSSNSTLLSCTVQSLQAGSTTTVTVVLTPTQNQQGQPQTFNGGTVTVTGANNVLFASTVVFGNMSDYTLSAFPSNVSVQAGSTASYQVQVMPSPIYSSNISLSYSLQATGTSCTFTTPTVTLNGSSPGSSTLNCLTTPRPVLPTGRAVWTREVYAVWLSFPGLAVLGLGIGGKRRRRIAGMMLGLILATVLFLPACTQPATQPPATGTPAGTYSLTVTATSGSDVKNYPLTLNVT